MSFRSTQPLPSPIWFREMGRLAEWCRHAADDADDQAIRRAGFLSVLAPPGLQQFMLAESDFEEVEALLDRNEIEEAAKKVLGTSISIEVQETDDGTHIASVGVPGDPAISCEAPTGATAMVGVWSAFFVGGSGIIATSVDIQHARNGGVAEERVLSARAMPGSEHRSRYYPPFQTVGQPHSP